MESGPQGPVVSGVSPNEGQPGTRLTIRGENLGDSLRDILGVSPSLSLSHTVYPFPVHVRPSMTYSLTHSAIQT